MISVLHSFLMLSGRAKGAYLGILFLRVFSQALEIIGLSLLAVLAGVLAGQSPGTDNFPSWVAWVSPPVGQSGVLRFAIIVSAVFVLKTLIGVGLLRITTLFLAVQEARAARRIAQFLYTRSLSQFSDLSIGEMQWILSRSTAVAVTSLLFAGATVATEIALFVAVFIAIFSFNSTAAIAMLVYFLLLVLSYQLVLKGSLRRLGKRLSENGIRLNQVVLDMSSAFREIVTGGKAPIFLREFAELRHRQARDSGLNRFLLGMPRYVVEISLVIGVFLVLLFETFLSVDDSRYGLSAVILAGGARLIAAIIPLQNAVSDIRINRPQADKALALIRRLSLGDGSLGVDGLGSAEEGSGSSQGPGPLRIDCSSATFYFSEQKVPAVENVTFSVEPGEFVALIGPSGAGKTTIANLVAGLEKPKRGTVTVGGLEPSKIWNRQVGGIGYVGQRPEMVSGTVEANVALGVPPASIERERVEQSLILAGLGPELERGELRVAGSIGEQKTELSQGQLQRIGIARALYSQPGLLILDEATSSLDAETEHAISNTIYGLKGKVTLLVIAHRLATVKKADNVLLVQSGGIVDSGDFADLYERSAVVRRYADLLSA